MRYLLLWLFLGITPVLAQSGPGVDTAKVVASCGSQSYSSGQVQPFTQDTTGALCTNGVSNPTSGNFSAGSLTLTGNSVISGSTAASTSEIYWSGTMSGTCSGAPGCFANSLIIINDSLVSTASNGSGNLQVQTTITNGVLTGGVVNFQSYLIVSGATANLTNQDLVSANLWAAATTSVGGTGGSPLGALFAINPQALLITAATNWEEVSVDEHDLGIDSSSSAAYAYLYKAILTQNNATAASVDSAAFTIGMKSGGTATLSCGLCGGANGSASPLASTADFIGWHGSGTAPSIVNGINLSKFTLSGGAMVGPGSSSLVFQSGGNQQTVFNDGGNGAVFVINAINASATARLNLTPGTGAGGGVTLAEGGAGTGGMTVQGGAGSLTLQGGTTTGIIITTGGVAQVPNVATGTPAASLCIDASNNVIKKTTTGSCI